MISAAVVAAVIGFVPTAAQAADQPAERRGSAAAAMDAVTAAAAKSAVFHSPAERTVRTSGKAAAPQAAGAADAAGAKGNAGLAVDLRASATSAHGFSLASQISATAGANVKVDIDWGDGKTDTQHVTGAKLLTSKHTFAEVGKHKVTVTLTDQDNNVTATNSVDVQASGSKFTPHAPTRL
ncbi:PKD domain-containing protein, partial [Streptomyces sp. WAC05950]